MKAGASRLSIFGTPSAQHIFVQEALKYIPITLLEYWLEHSSNPRLHCLRETKAYATELAKGMVSEKAEYLLQGKDTKDIFTSLGKSEDHIIHILRLRVQTVKSNMDIGAKNKLSDEELYAQMRYVTCSCVVVSSSNGCHRLILIAGHETTAHTINWALLELARNSEMQTRLRAEIRDCETAIRSRGDSQFTVADLEGMPYMTAIVKASKFLICHVWKSRPAC